MADDEVCGDTNMTVLLQNDGLPCDPFWLPTSSATFHGTNPLVHVDNVGIGDAIDASFFQQGVEEKIDDEDCEVGLNPMGKKRRLTATQVQFLERNFEVENKLEPKRKIQIAKELGLHPRQVAIWFQNRRARFKNKQLEKEYDLLRATCDGLKADYENLLKEKENLKDEVFALKEKLLVKGREVENLDSLCAINSSNAEVQKSIPNTLTEKVSIVTMVTPIQEDANSAKSDVLASDSPHSLLEPANSSHVFEAEQSDFSQDEVDNLRRSFLTPPCFSKLYHDLPANSCNFESPMDDQPFWSWTY